MSTTMLVAGVAIGVATMLVVLMLLPQPAGDVLEQRLGHAEEVDFSALLDPRDVELQRPISERVVGPVIQAIGRFMMRRTKVAQLDAIRLKLAQAGSHQREIRLGRPRSDALLGMSERNAVEELSAFVRAVVQAEPLGVSITNVLRIQSEELRRLRKQRAEEAGHRAPVLMLLPMMGCIFPCIFICLLGPTVLTIITPSH